MLPVPAFTALVVTCPPWLEKGEDHGGEAAENLGALNDAEREVEAHAKALPEGKVGYAFIEENL